MKKWVVMRRWEILITVFLMNVAPVFCSAEVTFCQADWPQDGWCIFFSINQISSDILTEYTGEEWPEHSYCFQLINLRNDGGITLDPNHPFISKRLFFHPDSAISMPTVGFIAATDQQKICGYAIDALTSMAMLPAPFSIDTISDIKRKGFVLSIHFLVYGVEIKGDCYISKGQSLPDGVLEIFALMRRSLPPSYKDYFEYLRVPVLPPLSGNERNEIKRCPLHNCWMKVDVVPVGYGLPMEDDYTKAERQFFPYACTSISGGCTGGKLEEDLTLYCPDCRKVMEQWLKEHKDQRR